MFFLNTGRRLLAVTAAHVYDAHIADKDAQQIECYFGALRIKPEMQIISRGQRVDIITFDMTAEQLEATGKNIVTAWPPAIPREGCGVFFGGFPAREVLREGAHDFAYGFMHGILPVRTVTDHQITCRIERAHLLPTPGLGPTLPPPNYDAGGFSGGPLFTLIDGDNLQTWRLGGVVSEASATLEMITAVRADHISDDGVVAL